MTVGEELSKLLELIRLERHADMEQYRQKVLLRSLSQRTSEGTTWYPVRLKEYHVGTGERLIVELERTHNLDEPHSFQSGKVVNLFSNSAGKPQSQHTTGVVNYVRDNLIVITLNSEELPEWIDDRLLGVDVMFDEMTYREMEFALKEVMRADGRLAELAEILLGTKQASFVNVDKESRFVSLSLNAAQNLAVQKAIAAQDVAIVHGPPGTGKTTTLVEAIAHTIKEEKQVLVCAPSNAAVDLLVEKLSEKKLDVIRIGHPARVTSQSLGKTIDARIASHQHYDELRLLRRKMEQLKAAALKYKRHYGHHEKEQRRMLLNEARALKSDADLLEFHIVNDLLGNCQAICCTLIGCSHPMLKGRRFKTVFIDEGGQALEPACWVALLRSSRVILAGDHQQLPPTIKSQEASRLGLATTLFEKIISRHPNTATMLEVQYRMHADIMKFPSHYFYDDRLVAHDSVRTAVLRPNQSPVEFIDTAGCGFHEGQDPETLSRFNEDEARLLIQRLEQLVEEVGQEEWLYAGINLGIIAPYRAQIDHLHKLAEASEILEPIQHLVSIQTVDGFQGQERDVIGISFVRSNDKSEVGFLADVRRTNVAMTRAKKKLIMVGDSATLGSHPFYLGLINFVQEKDFYRSAFS